ncbi:MAG TPA: GGDEF domain-containing protein [Pirellulales bacterium]|nr:GGDEF domain-containing protein [Pirellulales bacterium]
MEWVALGLVLNLLCFCALAAFAFYRVHSTKPEPTAMPAAAGEPTDRKAADNGDWLERLASKIDDDIDCHSFHIEQIGVELRDATGSGTDDVLKAAARILIANRRLQRDLAEAQKEIQQQRQEVASLAAEARTDTLTGLPNRRSLNEDLARRFDQWRRHQIPLSLLMVDVDHFKKLNDTHGHQTGDEVLRLVAQALRKTLRQMDMAARFGGEEFAILLPGTRLKDAATVAERMRAAVAADCRQCAEREVKVTVSLGLASVVADETVETLIKRADDALYAAKNAGRNRAFLHDGTNALAIAPDSGAARQPFTEKQYIAPYNGHGRLPADEEFLAVQCHDLSAGGFSFICDEPPDFQKFVVRLGKGAEAYYVVARIANVVDIGAAGRPRYRIGCSFLERIGGAVPSPLNSTASSPPIVISDPQTGLLSFPPLTSV